MKVPALHKIIFSFLILSLLSGIISCETDAVKKPTQEQTASRVALLQNKAMEAEQYCLRNDFNTDFCMLIDMGLHSGLKRFYIWNFNRSEITHSYLVSHGCCSNIWSRDFTKNNPTFSNVSGSHCSSLGKYKIGQRGYSNWGIHIKYLLHGLEPSNSNAQKRDIVFHSWDLVPNEEVHPRGTPEGWGCPALSNESFKIVDQLLQQSSKPVLMWIYSS
jgi:hypothetical protein